MIGAKRKQFDTYLVPERIKKPDGIDLEDGVYGALFGLQVLENVI